MNLLLEHQASLTRRAFAVAIGAMAVGAALPSYAEPLPLGDVLACEMETYLVLDARDTLTGKWVPRKNAAAQAALASAEIGGLQIRLEPLSPGAQAWETRLEVTTQRLKQELPFTVPVGQVRGGYYRLHGGLVAKDDVIVAKGEAVLDNRTPVTLSLRQLRTPPPSSQKTTPRDYLAFVTQTVERLIERQSAALDGKPGGTRFITVARPVKLGYRSIGYKKADGTYESIWLPGTPMDYEPFLADIEAWTVLDRLSKLTGDKRYGAMTAAMADAFARHGFNPTSGLGYLGEEAAFDVLRVRGASAKINVANVRFKPKNTGTYPQQPLDRLWTHAPSQTRRMFRDHLHLDGRPYLETARYTFRTQAEKDAAVKLDPMLAQVKVYDGAGFYQPGTFWEHY